MNLIPPVAAVLTLSLLGSCSRAVSSLEQNKKVVRLQHEEIWSKGNLALVDQIYARNFVCHFIVGQEWRGHQGLVEAVQAHRASFPDWTEQIDDIIAEGDMVVTRFTSRGTHHGEFEGISPTGRHVTIAEVAVYRIERGKIAEQWGFPDVLSLQRQLTPEASGKP